MQEAAQAAGAPRRPRSSRMTRVSVAGHRRAHAPPPHRPRAGHGLARDGARRLLLGQADLRRRPGQRRRPTSTPRCATSTYAARCVMAAKIFDWGTACASEQSAIVDRSIAGLAAGGDGAPGRALPLRRRSRTRSRSCSSRRAAAAPSNVEAVSQSPADARAPGRLLDPRRHAAARRAPGRHRLRLPALARDPRARSSSSSRSTAPDEGIATAVAQLRFGGDGHTAAVHAGDEAVISRYAEAAPAYRVLVNTPSLFGAMGYSTGVDRTFMIGTGTIGGSISSDNIGVRHLHQPQARGGADPRLGDADERPGRSARGRLGDQPRARRRAEHDGAPRPRLLPRPPPRPLRCRRRRARPAARARASRSSCARRSRR